MAAFELQNAIIELLKRELGSAHTVSLLRDQILIQISTADFEHRLGNFLQQIYSVIDHHGPKRNEHISLIIRDVNQRYENVFKIWKSVF
ncbi:hypothetical protein [Mucilaginibacter terrae]|uniref:Uncharacterized protein n=1 Tax=Mucilaginibacter terrae TaxID=1955052 RepID=A0ABU3GN89_9SPHI|nr:hypothetical protein [Mucilaginibacter terrae]MDT3400956.1 hypothetical protein [Mucilaginibacter terrae]